MHVECDASACRASASLKGGAGGGVASPAARRSSVPPTARSQQICSMQCNAVDVGPPPAPAEPRSFAVPAGVAPGNLFPQSLHAPLKHHRDTGIEWQGTCMCRQKGVRYSLLSGLTCTRTHKLSRYAKWPAVTLGHAAAQPRSALLRSTARHTCGGVGSNGGTGAESCAAGQE